MWFLLKKEIHSAQFQQMGPYTTSQLSSGLKTGFCSSQDFVWRESFKEWKRISILSEFLTHPCQTMEDILTYQSRQYQQQKPRNIRYLDAPVLKWPEMRIFIKDLYSPIV